MSSFYFSKWLLEICLSKQFYLAKKVHAWKNTFIGKNKQRRPQNNFHSLRVIQSLDCLLRFFFSKMSNISNVLFREVTQQTYMTRNRKFMHFDLVADRKLAHDLHLEYINSYFKCEVVRKDYQNTFTN